MAWGWDDAPFDGGFEICCIVGGELPRKTAFVGAVYLVYTALNYSMEGFTQPFGRLPVLNSLHEAPLMEATSSRAGEGFSLLLAL